MSKPSNPFYPAQRKMCVVPSVTFYIDTRNGTVWSWHDDFSQNLAPLGLGWRQPINWLLSGMNSTSGGPMATAAIKIESKMVQKVIEVEIEEENGVDLHMSMEEAQKLQSLLGKATMTVGTYPIFQALNRAGVRYVRQDYTISAFSTIMPAHD